MSSLAQAAKRLRRRILERPAFRRQEDRRAKARRSEITSSERSTCQAFGEACIRMVAHGMHYEYKIVRAKGVCGLGHAGHGYASDDHGPIEL